MEDIMLYPTGQRPIKTTGELIATAGSNDGRATRWHWIDLYRTAGGNFVLVIDYHTRWQGEQDKETVFIEPTPQAVASRLEEYRPEKDAKGFPVGQQYAAKQARLDADLRERFGVLVTQILRELPDCAQQVD